MPIAWPSTVPAPIAKGLRIKQTDIRRKLRMDAGNVRQIRRGTGAPRALSVTFFFSAAQFLEFKKFVLFDLGNGVDWFTADWTTQIGFPGAQIRFVAPFRAVYRGPYSEVSAELEIQGDGGVVAVYSQPGQREDLDFGQTQTGSYSLMTWFDVSINDDGRDDLLTRAGVAISNNADVLAVAVDPSGIGNNEQIAIYRRQSDDSYLQVGSILSPLPVNSQFGWSLSISGGGFVLVVGTKSADTVHVYDLSIGFSTATLRVQLAPTIVGDTNGFGTDVRLSADGKYLTVSDHPIVQSGVQTRGITYVFWWDGTVFQQLAAFGVTPGDNLYAYGSLSLLGQQLALITEDGGRYEFWQWNAAMLQYDFDFFVNYTDHSHGSSRAVGLSADGTVMISHGRAETTLMETFPIVDIWHVLNSNATRVDGIWYADDGDSLPEWLTDPKGESGLRNQLGMHMTPNASHIAMMATVWPQNLPHAHVYIYKNV